MKRIKALIVSTLALTLSLAGLAAPVAVYAADPIATVCTTLESGADCSKTTNGININGVIVTIINLMSVLVGIAAVIMIIVSGFRYVTSGGDSNKITGAKSTLIYAIIGLVIVALSQTMVKFVLEGLRAPNCPAGQTVDLKTNKCIAVKKKAASGSATYYHITVDNHRTLNYRVS
jgi:hypothetical protein